MKTKFILGLWMALQAIALEAQTVSSLRINEVMAANVEQILDPTWNYGGWVEVYNPTGRELNLKGLWISDDARNLCKLKVNHSVPVPAKGYANLWMDHCSPYWPQQLPMKLDCDGGMLYLSAAMGKVIDSVQVAPAIPRTSYARSAEGEGTWAYTASPTPGNRNEGPFLQTGRMEAPRVKPESQLFAGVVNVQVDIPEGAELRYTLDGSAPTPTHGAVSTTGKFMVAVTRVFRFALFREGYLPSPVVTRSYIKRDKTFNLPVVSVVSDPKHLYSDSLGVFTKGTNGRRGKGTSEYCNWNQDWERPVNFEMLHPKSGECLVNMEADLSRCGGHSKGFTPFSFKIKASKKYEGKNELNYAFFPDNPYLKHKTLQFRGGGNDYLCRIKDAALQTIIQESGMDVDLQDYVPVCHYVNGAYMGTINMREPNNKHNIYAHYGLDDEEIDLYEIDCDSGYVQMCGTRDAWEQLKRLSQDAANPQTYAEIARLLDVDECCNYMALQLFLGNNDWPQNNLKAWRPVMQDGKFRFIVFDLDYAFYNDEPFSVFASRQWCTFCELFDVPGVTHLTREVEIVPIFMNLLKNQDFRRRFVDAFSLVAGAVFAPDVCRRTVNRLVSAVEYMQTRPSGYAERNISPRASADEVILKLAERAPMLHQALQHFGPMQLAEAGQEVTLSTAAPGAVLRVNGQTVPRGCFDGRLYPPVVLQAQAPANQRFVGWKSMTDLHVGAGKTLLSGHAEWKYSDVGQVPSNWRFRVYSDRNWKKGKAPLGYGNHYNAATVIGYGNDAEQKHTTSYFRATFQLDEVPTEGDIVMDYALDDGCVVYVNGREATRIHMPQGSVNFHTPAATTVGHVAAQGRVVLEKSLFRAGENLVAVEVHNASASSSDLYWKASIRHEVAHDVPAGGWLSTEETLELPSASVPIVLQACYEPLPQTGEQVLPQVVINEVSAANSVFVNEYFKKRDWVELYNTTDVDIDLEGMYLSDEVHQPQKYRLSAEGGEATTVIPAHGHRIVWCDALPARSQLHAPFELRNADSAAVVLTAADGSWADTLVYCAHNGMETVGRFPDGGAQLYRMYRPTIEKCNRMNSYTTFYKEPEVPASGTGSGMGEMMASHAGGLSLHMIAGVLCVKSEEDEALHLRVCTTDGKVAMSRNVRAEGGHAQVRVDLLAPGTYVAQVQDAEGNSCAMKFVK